MDASADEATIARELAKLPEAEAAPLELDEADEGLSACLFLALGTQWRTAGQTGILAGLDYQAIRPTADLLGIPLDRQRFLDLRDMEAEALKTVATHLRGSVR